MKLLVFGKTGQVARELQRLAPDATYLGRDEADLGNPFQCVDAIKESDADAIINAAAWTAVDAAESDELNAFQVNGNTPECMALTAAERDIPFLHISTDYVFDGQGDKPFTPDHPTAPQNAYGRTKLLGEQGIRNALGNHLILRTSWVVSAHGSNFVKTMLRLGKDRETLNVVADQIGGPTPAAAIAQALLTAAQAMTDGAPGGTHHFAGTPDTSWADFARAIMAEAILPCRITDIPTSDYPTPAKRPLNSRLDCSAFTAAFGIPRPDWREGLEAIVKELRP
ncbi:MAG: dTDP-4-dehydrorhamnose reductase [Rhodobacteraceae bacterium]|nr:MAG: dTDP-4-dehydrorhamnose reductase [Paracoccaceae bacterium]